jgi:hypothetical protein
VVDFTKKVHTVDPDGKRLDLDQDNSILTKSLEIYGKPESKD